MVTYEIKRVVLCSEFSFIYPAGVKDLPAGSQEADHCFFSREAVWGASRQATSFVSDQGEDILYNTEEKVLRLGSSHFSFVFHSVSPVSRPACFPVLVSPQSDGIQHRTLFGPPAAYRRIWEEESPGRRIWGFPETPKRTTQVMCAYHLSGFLPSRVAVDIVKAALYRSELSYLGFFFF